VLYTGHILYLWDNLPNDAWSSIIYLHQWSNIAVELHAWILVIFTLRFCLNVKHTTPNTVGMFSAWTRDVGKLWGENVAVRSQISLHFVTVYFSLFSLCWHLISVIWLRIPEWGGCGTLKHSHWATLLVRKAFCGAAWLCNLYLSKFGTCFCQNNSFRRSHVLCL
jgi:hypothetical protein